MFWSVSSSVACTVSPPEESTIVPAPIEARVVIMITLIPADPATPASTGIGTVNLFAKIGLVDPEGTRSHVGLAVIPLVEIASASAGTRRTSWAVPVSVEARAGTGAGTARVSQ